MSFPIAQAKVRIEPTVDVPIFHPERPTTACWESGGGSGHSPV